MSASTVFYDDSYSIFGVNISESWLGTIIDGMESYPTELSNESETFVGIETKETSNSRIMAKLTFVIIFALWAVIFVLLVISLLTR